MKASRTYSVVVASVDEQQTGSKQAAERVFGPQARRVHRRNIKGVTLAGGSLFLASKSQLSPRSQPCVPGFSSWGLSPGSLSRSLSLSLPIQSIAWSFSTEYPLRIAVFPYREPCRPRLFFFFFLDYRFFLLPALKQAIPWHAQPGKASAFSSFGLFSFASSFDVGRPKVEPQPHARCTDRQSRRPTRAIQN